MINLLPEETKKDIRAARLNIVLVQYAVALLLLALLVTAVYAVGFWLVYTEKVTIDKRIEAQSQQTKEFEQLKKSADAFRSDLKIAKTILTGGTVYSDFLISLGQQMPSETIISSLALNEASSSKEITFQARTASYPKALELKSALEATPLFENVSIDDVTRPPQLSGLGGISAKYPFEVSLRATVSRQGTTQ